MTEKALKISTREFAVAVLSFVDELPNRRIANIIGNQLGGTRSHAGFIAKIGIL